MEAPDFWDDAEVSQKKMKELKDMKDDMETYQNLVTQMEDMETMIEMGYEENDPALIPEIQEMLDEFQKDFDNIRIKTLLSGEYDSENAIIKLNAGAGGTEACDWCGMLYRMYSRWADKKGFTLEVLDYLDGRNKEKPFCLFLSFRIFLYICLSKGHKLLEGIQAALPQIPVSVIKYQLPVRRVT